MIYSHARKLHNGDEVTIKKTREVVKVLTAVVERKTVRLDVQSSRDGFQTLLHTDVK